MKSIIIALVVFALVGLGIFTLSAKKETSLAGKPTVRVVAIYPMTGNLAHLGEAAKAASKIFFDNFNKKNHRFNYELTFEDDSFAPQKTVSIVKRLISLKQADVVLTLMSTNAVAIAPIVQSAKLPHISSAVLPEIAKMGRYNFILAPNMDDVASTFKKTLIEKRIKKTTAVVGNAANMVSYWNLIEKQLNADDSVKLLSVDKINPGERDFRLMIQKQLAEKPDAIIAMLLSPEIEIFMRQIKEMNVQIPVTGIINFGHLKEKKLAEGLWYIDPQKPSNDFLETFTEKTGMDTTNYGELIYAKLELITNAAEKLDAASFNSEHFVDALLEHSSGLETASGKVKMSNEGIGKIPHVVLKIKNGKSVPAEEIK